MANSVSLLDYSILFLTLLISSGIGVYFRFTGGKQKTAEEYLVADRSLPVLPVAFSLTTNFMSAVTLLGVSSENYMFGTHFVVINLGYLLFTGAIAYLLLPKFYCLRTFSAYEYLRVRFGVTARIVTSLCFLIQTILYMGIVLYAPALVMKSILGVSETLSIILVGLVGAFYSTIGGMKAVIVADVFQSLMMYFSLFGIIIIEAIDRGGLLEIWNSAYEHGRVDFSNFSVDPTERHTWFSLVIGGGLTYVSLYGVNQTQIQRYISMKGLKQAQQALWLQWVLLVILSLTTSFSGLAIFSKYRDCDPIKLGRIKKGDELMPLFVKDLMTQYDGLAGLFLAGVMSACLTTVSASLNSLSAVTLEDYAKPLYTKITRKILSDSLSARLSKVFSLCFGFMSIGMAFMTRHLGAILQASLSILGTMGGPVVGIFTLGLFAPMVEEVGAVVGLLSGLCVSSILAFGGPKAPPVPLPTSIEGCSDTVWPNMTQTNPVPPKEVTYAYIYRISYLWYIVVGFSVTVIVGLTCSFVYKSFKNHKLRVTNRVL